jgi:hypothetical protein
MDLSPVITPIPSGRAYESQEAQRLQTFSGCYELARKTHGVIPSLFQAWKNAKTNKDLASKNPGLNLLYAQNEREQNLIASWPEERVLDKLHEIQADLYYLRAPAVLLMQKRAQKIEDLTNEILTLEETHEDLSKKAKSKKADIKYPAKAELQKIEQILKEKTTQLKSLLNYQEAKKTYEDSFDHSLFKERLGEFQKFSMFYNGSHSRPEVLQTLEPFVFRNRTKIEEDLNKARETDSKRLQAIFEEEEEFNQYTREEEPLLDDDLTYIPFAVDELDTPKPSYDALYQSPTPDRRFLKPRHFTYVRKLDLPLDQAAPKKSVLRESIVKRNIFTQAALFIHKLCKDHSIFYQGEWKKDSYLLSNGAPLFANLFAKVHKSGFVGAEAMVGKIGFVITDLFLHLTTFFDKQGYSSKDEIVSRFIALKKSHGAIKGGTLALLESVFKTLSTLIAIGLSVGALTLEALFFLLSKISAAIVGSLVYLLTLEKIWLGGLVVGTAIGGVALHAVNLAVIILLMIPYGILRYRARKKEVPDFMHLTLDQRNAHILGLSSSRHPPLHYSLNPLEFYTNKENQTAFLDTFTRRPIDERDGFHQSPTEKFLASCTAAELREKCDAYQVSMAGFSPLVEATFNEHTQTNTWVKRQKILKNLHYFRLELCSHLCRYDRIRKDRLIDLLNKGDIHLLHLYLQCIGGETPETRINDDDLRLIQGAAEGVFI